MKWSGKWRIAEVRTDSKITVEEMHAFWGVRPDDE
jgi:hypothetical protein